MDDFDYRQAARRITLTLFTAQSLASAAFVASSPVSVMVAAELSGSAAWAGLPTAVMQLSMAFAALGVAGASERLGRRPGLALGLSVGVLGCGLGVMAIAGGWFLLFLAGAVLLGVAGAAVKLLRFAAAEVHTPSNRGRAISRVVIGGAVGSVLGPLLMAPAGQGMRRAGISELLGPYLATLLILALAAMVVYFFLRPDPRDLGRSLAASSPESESYQGPTRRVSQILRTPAAAAALAAMVFGSVVMALVTGMVSLHMAQHNYALAGISVVISAHTLGMYALSTLAGNLADRWGRGSVILLGCALLVLSCMLAGLSADMLPLTIALFLLGVGWSFCYVAGSALLADQLSPEERAHTQGANDLVVGLGTAAASLSSGLIFGSTSYAVLGLAGAAIALVPMAWTARWMNKEGRLIWAWPPFGSGGPEPCPTC
jgi:MFS family permease